MIPIVKCFKFIIYNCPLKLLTRMHSSRMRTGRSLTVCRSLLPGGGVSAPGGCLLPRGCLLLGGMWSLLLGGWCVWSGGCMVPEVWSWGGVWSQGGLLRGVSGPGGVWWQGGVCSQGVISQHALRQTPHL